MQAETVLILLFSVAAAVAIAVQLLADIDARLLRLESGEEGKSAKAQNSGKNGDQTG